MTQARPRALPSGLTPTVPSDSTGPTPGGGCGPEPPSPVGCCQSRQEIINSGCGLASRCVLFGSYGVYKILNLLANIFDSRVSLYIHLALWFLVENPATPGPRGGCSGWLGLSSGCPSLQGHGLSNSPHSTPGSIHHQAPADICDDKSKSTGMRGRTRRMRPRALPSRHLFKLENESLGRGSLPVDLGHKCRELSS